eukprot:scaffold6699_cov20-Tisochrysis_lutea.AAC.7
MAAGDFVSGCACDNVLSQKKGVWRTLRAEQYPGRAALTAPSSFFGSKQNRLNALTCGSAGPEPTTSTKSAAVANSGSSTSAGPDA